ncbi:MAG TPA: hypothetical protein VGI75_10675, partial [Pirellulales bacterium]
MNPRSQHRSLAALAAGLLIVLPCISGPFAKADEARKPSASIESKSDNLSVDPAVAAAEQSRIAAVDKAMPSV